MDILFFYIYIFWPRKILKPTINWSYKELNCNKLFWVSPTFTVLFSQMYTNWQLKKDKYNNLLLFELLLLHYYSAQNIRVKVSELYISINVCDSSLRISISNTSATSLAPNCLSPPRGSDKGQWWERWAELGPPLGPSRPLVGRTLSVTPGREDQQQGAAPRCHCPPLHCLHLLKHSRYLSSRETHLLFI